MGRVKKKPARAPVDDIDLSILRTLQFDARATVASLSKTIGLTPTRCWKRIRRLEKKGVIQKYITVIDQSALGYADTVLIEVSLDRYDNAALLRFEEALSMLPEVVEAFRTTGEFGYFLKVAISRFDGCDIFLRERLQVIPGVRETRVRFVLGAVPNSTASPAAPRASSPALRRKAVNTVPSRYATQLSL